jgi:glycosyltransferase involved in cell wall biosynthesis
MTAKRIGIISDHASPLAALGGVDSGGQNVYVANIATGLGRLGYSVDIFTRKDRSDLPSVIPYTLGCRIINITAGPEGRIEKEQLLPFMEEFAERVRSFCATYGSYDLIHANFFMSGLVAVRLKYLLGIPFVVTFHALGRIRRIFQKDTDRFPEERFEIEEEIVENASGIVAECPQDRQDLIKYYGADPARITVIPCGYAPEEFYPVKRATARRILGFGRDERIVLHLGRMVPRKGIDNLIRGFALMLRRNPGMKARLVIVGGDTVEADPAATPEIGRLQAVAAAEAVADRVVFKGQVGRGILKFFYSASDVFVTTPWYEPFGITPVEAMACGTPVIGSRVGGLKFSIRDGKTGFLVPPFSPAALAEKLSWLLSDRKLREHVSNAAVKRARELFTWDKVVYSLTGLYEKTVVPRVSETDGFTLNDEQK